MAYEYIVDKGTIVPNTSTTLGEVQTEYKNALGQDLNLDPNTPQGQLITAEVLARNGVIRNNVQLANQLNPNQATGTFLRAIGGLMGINDTPMSRSVCLGVEITGAPLTLFPSGAVATNPDGAEFISIDPIMLDASGEGVVNFQAVQVGPIEALAHTLQPAQAIPGWSRADNPTDATLGSAALTDYQFRIFRQQALANQANNSVAATYSKLAFVPGVKSVTVRDNDASTAQTVDGVAMEANSLWVCVNDDGGLDTDIAQVLLACKAPGCKWSLSTNASGSPRTVAVVEPNSGQTYTVKFVRSIPVPVFTRIYVKNVSTMADLSTAVVNAILAYVAGQTENDPGLVVGADVSPFEISGAVIKQIPGTYVRLCEVSVDGITWTTTPVDIQLWQRALLPRGNINVVVE